MAIYETLTDGFRKIDETSFCAAGRTYAFTNQWGHRTISALNNLIQAFPDRQIMCTKSEDQA